MKTNLKLNVFGVKIDSFFYHTYYPSLSSMTWTLDYDKKSTLGESPHSPVALYIRNFAVFVVSVKMIFHLMPFCHPLGGKGKVLIITEKGPPSRIAKDCWIKATPGPSRVAAVKSAFRFRAHFPNGIRLAVLNGCPPVSL